MELLPRKIMKTLAHLLTRARVLGGILINLLSREVLRKMLLLQPIHRMTIWMTLSSHDHMRRNIQVPKLLRRVEAEKRFYEDMDDFVVRLFCVCHLLSLL
jgi:hypothetical protein